MNIIPHSIKSITAKKEKKTNPNYTLGRLVRKYFLLKICTTGSPVVKNLASNAGDLDLIPGPWGTKILCAWKLTTKPAHCSY